MNIILTKEHPWCWYDWQCWSVSLSALIITFSHLALLTWCLLSLPFDLPELFPAIELKARIWSFTTHTCCISACQFKYDLVTYSWIRKVTNGGQARWHVVRQLVSLNFGAVFYMLVLSLLFTGCTTKACQWMQLQRLLLLIGCWVGTACSDEIGMQKKKEKREK